MVRGLESSSAIAVKAKKMQKKKGMEGERSRPDGTVMKVQLAVVVLKILVVILMISSFNRARDRIGEYWPVVVAVRIELNDRGLIFPSMV